MGKGTLQHHLLATTDEMEVGPQEIFRSQLNKILTTTILPQHRLFHCRNTIRPQPPIQHRHISTTRDQLTHSPIPKDITAFHNTTWALSMVVPGSQASPLRLPLHLDNHQMALTTALRLSTCPQLTRAATVPILFLTKSTGVAALPLSRWPQPIRAATVLILIPTQ